jgi:RNA polymerase sigma-70 factor (ECF subfamily)
MPQIFHYWLFTTGSYFPNGRESEFAAETIIFSAMEEKQLAIVTHSKMDPSLDPIRAQIIALLPRLRRFAIALTGSIADGDDLVQDTVERALKGLHLWEEGTRLDSWMFRIARNRFIDGRRSAKREGTVIAEAPEDVGSASMDGEQALMARLALKDLLVALHRLPVEQREAVALVLIEGASYRDASDMLDIPIGTLTSRIARARESLATALGE